ncbi:hypothetical protein SynMVIR181_02762 [Synechococcus sp. MVIR-18-1]|nr:hypothetical protein SynMVIR181_02762 [Synechococcus sp. MVIR-18-1]
MSDDKKHELIDPSRDGLGVDQAKKQVYQFYGTLKILLPRISLTRQ